MVYDLEHSPTHSLTYSSLTHYSLIHSLIHSLTHSLIHSLTHSLSQSHTHSCTHCFTLAYNLCLSLPLFLYVCLCLSVCLSVCLCFCFSVFPPSGSPQGIYQLHYAPGYTQSQLLRLVTEIYDGVPESFEVFYCHPLTTQEELKMFMERVKYHPLPYLVLQVNKLPFNLQEVCKMYHSVCLSFYSSINLCACVYTCIYLFTYVSCKKLCHCRGSVNNGCAIRIFVFRKLLLQVFNCHVPKYCIS